MLSRRTVRFRNREGLLNFEFTLEERYRPAGVSAMMRVRNEERKLAACLRSIYDLFDEIVIVDNASDDRTLQVARTFKAQWDRADKIRLYAYPFRVARLGPEHAATPEDSVRCIAYYYNWCLSRCSRRYVCKWDADMIVPRDAREALVRLFRTVQHRDMCWSLWGQTVYRDRHGRCYRSMDELNEEIMLFPNGLNPRFFKGEAFEDLVVRPPLPIDRLDGVAFYELKCADEDEFSHWSTTEFPTLRKQREWERFQMIRNGALRADTFDRLGEDLLGLSHAAGRVRVLA